MTKNKRKKKYINEVMFVKKSEKINYIFSINLQNINGYKIS